MYISFCYLYIPWLPISAKQLQSKQEFSSHSTQNMRSLSLTKTHKSKIKKIPYVIFTETNCFIGHSSNWNREKLKAWINDKLSTIKTTCKTDNDDEHVLITLLKSLILSYSNKDDQYGKISPSIFFFLMYVSFWIQRFIFSSGSQASCK